MNAPSAPSSTFSAPLPLLVLTAGLLAGCGAEPAPPPAGEPGTHDDLIALFGEWRDFERPEFRDGVPDYGAEAMARQHAELSPGAPGWMRSRPGAGRFPNRSTGI